MLVTSLELSDEPDMLVAILPFLIPEMVMTTTALRWRF
jgi:hypothetical protein